VRVLQKAWNLLSDDLKAILQIAESNLNALKTVDLGPKRPFSVDESALWARLTGPQLAAQVVAVVSLVEAPDRRASTVAKLSGAEEQTARAISAHAQCACLLSLQMGSIN
jgi:hypothetical protein